MNVSRREFITSASAAGLLAGCRSFPCGGVGCGPRPSDAPAWRTFAAYSVEDEKIYG